MITGNSCRYFSKGIPCRQHIEIYESRGSEVTTYIIIVPDNPYALVWGMFLPCIATWSTTQYCSSTVTPTPLLVSPRYLSEMFVIQAAIGQCLHHGEVLLDCLKLPQRLLGGSCRTSVRPCGHVLVQPFKSGHAKTTERRNPFGEHDDHTIDMIITPFILQCTRTYTSTVVAYLTFNLLKNRWLTSMTALSPRVARKYSKPR